jgi:hypothetical protein
MSSDINRKLLKFGSLNVRSLFKKSNDIVDLITDYDLDVLALTETWHCSNTDLSLRCAAPSGYCFLDVPRAVVTDDICGQNHGGIAIFYRSCFVSRPLRLCLEPTTFEMLACSVRCGTMPFVYVVIYRPGSKPVSEQFFNEITSLFEIIVTFRSQLVVCGDFNIHIDDKEDRHGRRLLSLLEAFDLVQHILEPTHTLGHTLDLVITRRETVIVSKRINPPFYSDHGLVLCNFLLMSLANITHRTVRVRNWKHLDRESFRQCIRASALFGNTNAYAGKTVSDLFVIYTSVLCRIIDDHAPARAVTQKQCPLTPWFDADCRASRRRARMLERRYRLTRSAADCQAWLRQLELKRTLLRQKESTYWSEIITRCGGNSKKLWRCLNNLFLCDDAKNIQHVDISANALSVFFQTKIDAVRTSTSGQQLPMFKELVDVTFHQFDICSDGDLRRIIFNAPAKSCSLDPLPNFLLRENLDDLLPFIKTVCNASLREGILPVSQKVAIIKPIVKKPGLDPNSESSYRPISNLTFLSKVIERIVAEQLTKYLTVNCLFPLVQSAYRACHSTETAVLKISSDVLDAADRSEVTLLALLDLTAAFDTVDHDILLMRLRKSYGICGQALTWISSFLGDRSQFVSFADQVSPTVNVTCGVPQGSVLGPLLFILYVADVIDIAAKHGVNCHCYADDIQLYVHCRAEDADNAVVCILECIREIELWMTSNRLKLNPEKTQFSWLGTWQQLSKFNLKHFVMSNGTTILASSTILDLGATFDENMKMDAHINRVVRSCSYQLRQLRTVRGSLSVDSATALVHAFITSRIDYCNSILYGVSENAIAKFQLILNAAARLISGHGKFDHITPVLRNNLHWLPVEYRVRYKIALFVFNCLRGNSPGYLSDMLQPVFSATSSRQLRSVTHCDLCVPAVRTHLGSRSFRHCGPTVWNMLPPSVKDPTITLAVFKQRLKTYLFKVAYNIN